MYTGRNDVELERGSTQERGLIDQVDCVDERGCTSQQLYAKKKGRYSIHCVTHSSPEARGLALMKPGNHAGYTKSYQDEWPRDDQKQVMLMDRGAMP